MVDLDARESQQPDDVRGFVQMPFHEARRELRRVAGHIDDDRCLERIVRKRTGPGRRTSAGDREAVTRAAEPVGARDQVVVRRGDAPRQVDQAQQVIGVDGVVAARIADAVREFAQVDSRAAGRPELFAHGIEVFDGQRMRQRLLDQLLQGVARFGQCFREILHQRLLVELGGGEREPDGDLFARARLGRAPPDIAN